MARILFTIFFVGLIMQTVSIVAQDTSFETKQLQFERVKDAYSAKGEKVNSLLRKAGIAEVKNILLRAFKKEKLLEVWVENNHQIFTKLVQYKICNASGKLGPKRKQGDYQVPEGFYQIQVFNPKSLYLLSLGINYPNQSDSILSKADDKGGDIYIHGDCASIGCLAMTDTVIQEVYLLAVKARNAGQETIPVQIFPFKMNPKNVEIFLTNPIYKPHWSFWNNLKEGYAYFEKEKKLPLITVNEKGKYLFN